MNWTTLSTGGFFAGLAALAGILFLLQRLRVRHREVPVVTTLFWKEAVEEARARVLVKRFRHPLAYLFVLLIASLLWLGFAGPAASSESGREHVVLIDGSAGMSRVVDDTTRFARVVETVRERLDELPRDHTRVVLCAGRAETLLAPSESVLLFERRAESIEAEASVASVERELLLLADADLGDVTIHIAGDAPIRPEVLALVTESGRIAVERLDEPDRLDPNAGITGMGVTPARSGDWNKVDVFVEVAGEAARVDLQLALELDGESVAWPATRESRTDAGFPRKATRIIFRDVPASGGRLEARIAAEDSLSMDDVAAIRLPERPLIRVALSDSLRDVLGPALEADPAVVLSTDAARVAIRMQGEAIGGAVPALEFVSRADQAEAFLIEHEASSDSLDVLLTSVNRLGLDEIDVTGMAEAAADAISVGAAPAEMRGLDVWSSLLSNEFNFIQSRSFPLFIAQSVRWLAGEEEVAAYAGCGDELAAAVHVDDQDRQLDPVGAAFVPARVGDYASERGAVSVSLLDPLTSLVASEERVAYAATLPVGDRQDSGAGSGLLIWIALLALLLLLVEWALVRTGRMP